MANLSDIAVGTLIGFTGNKTVTDAKKDTTTNRVDICKTKELYFNGERLGVTDEEQTFLENGLNSDGSVKASKVKTSAGSDIETYVKNNIVGAYKFKSSVGAISEILSQTCNKGDVFNVTSAFTLNGQSFSAGTNVAVNTSFTANGGKESNLDALGGVTIDTTHFANLYKYSESVLPTKDYTSDNVDSNLQGNIDTWVEIASHLNNRDLVMIESTPGSGGVMCELLNGYTIKYGSNTILMLFSYGSKEYYFSLKINEGSVGSLEKVTISDSLEARVKALENQLKLV